MKVKLSVVLLTYNHEIYIRQAIESILEQETDFDFEVLVGDDKSSDNSPNILQEYADKYPSKIKLYLRENNLGPTENLYDLYKKCSGEYIATLEGDDYWSDCNKLQRQVTFLDSNKEYIATTHKVEHINEKDEIIGVEPNFIYDELQGEELVIEYQKKKLLCGHFQSFVFRNIFIGEDHKEFITCSRFIADVQLRYLLLQKGKVKYLDYTMGKYRHIKNNKSYSSLDLEKQMKYSFEVWDKINEVSEHKYNKDINYIKDMYRITYMKMLIKRKNYSRALLYYISKIEIKGKIECIKIIIKKLKFI